MAIKIRTNFFPPLDKPKMYFVYILNDNYISWEFCMKTLKDVFHKNEEEATALTDEILNYGEAICGVYLFDVAETKAEIVEEQAKKKGLSMMCLVEEV